MSSWRPNHVPRRVLIAEDDEEMRAVLVEALRADGHSVVGAADGKRALTYVLSGEGQQAPPHLVVSDVRMAGGDGLTLLEELHDRAPFIPVILVTAFRSSEVIERARRADAVAVFEKPFDLDDLRTAVLLFASRSADLH